LEFDSVYKELSLKSVTYLDSAAQQPTAVVWSVRRVSLLMPHSLVVPSRIFQ